MKRYIGTVTIAVLTLWASALYAKPKIMSVQVDKREIRSGSSFMDSAVGEVTYGQRVEIIKEVNGWANIKLEGTSTTGWIHSSALSKKKIKLSAGDTDADVEASSGEIALAEKGFRETVENEYRKTHKNIDFAPVDKMVKLKVSAKEVKTFFNQGQVAPAKGGAK